MIQNITLFSVCALPYFLLVTNVFVGSTTLFGQNEKEDAHAYFVHGVASGDPLEDRLIIWTRITPKTKDDTLNVHYEVSQDSLFQRQMVDSGTFLTDTSRDFTVKIDIDGLNSGETYFFRFVYDKQISPTGRSKTNPVGDVEALRFAVMSCSNYEDGFFHTYRHASMQEGIQAVIHLGDYIYESFYTHKRKARDHKPAGYIKTLEDYRTRYAQYRLDPDLQEIHRLLPFITIWDDHEVSNDAYKDGTPYGEGIASNWATRLANAKQAYFEWMPIRDHPDKKIYRKVPFGELIDLFMLDTRFEGREAQIFDNANPKLAEDRRSMLGQEQLAWLLENIEQSGAQWKIIGNQVIFSPLYAQHIHQRVEDRLLDMWDGYPAERLRITQFLQEKNIQNTVIITGDFHSGFAFDVPVDDWNYPRTPNGPAYDPISGEHAVAVEFAVPSITSQNFDEFVLYAIPFRPIGRLGAKYVENQFLKPSVRDKHMPNKRRTVNPHMRWANLRWHGYVMLDITKEKIIANYHMIKNPWKEGARFRFSKEFEVMSGENHLKRK